MTDSLAKLGFSLIGVRRRLAATAVLTIAATIAATLVSSAALARQPEIADGRWIVVLEDPPTTRFSGGEVSASVNTARWSGVRFKPTAPEHSGAERLDVDSASVRAYTRYLDEQRSGVLLRATCIATCSTALPWT